MRFPTWLGAIPFAALSFAFGIGSFIQIDKWGQAYDQKMVQIRNGEVPVETLMPIRQYVSKGDESTDYYVVYAGTHQAQIATHVTKEYYASGEATNEVAAYWFPDGYLIPQHHTGGHHAGKWIFLGFGVGVGLLTLMGSLFARETKQPDDG